MNNIRKKDYIHMETQRYRKEFAKNFDRIIYFGDLHGTPYFKPFIEKYDNGRTLFISLGDLFDRGEHSYEIYTTIRELYLQGRFQMVLGNHDLFFLLAYGLRPGADNIISKKAEKVLTQEQRDTLWEIYNEQLYINRGDMTIRSFEEGVGKDKASRTINEVINFLFTNFDLYYEDPIGNLSIHAGIPILTDGSVVGETIGDKFVSGLDYVKSLNKGFKNLDYQTLLYLTGRGEMGDKIWTDMKTRGIIKDPNISANTRSDFSRYYLPTWYDNSVYEKTYGNMVNQITPLQSLRTELDRAQKERLIVGHWNVDTWNFSDRCTHHASLFYGTILRLDRSGNRVAGQYGNFGYAIVDAETNRIEEMGDAIELFHEYMQIF